MASHQEHWARRAKIVATLGPATDRPELVEAVLRAGVDVVRLNFAHGSRDEHARRIAWVRAASERLDRPVAILQDLAGPKLRTGPLAGGGPIRLADGDEVAVATEPIVGTAQRFAIAHPPLADELRPGDRVLLADGRIVLRVLGTSPGEVRARVERGGLLAERQGVSLPGVALSLPALTPKDEQDLEFGLAQGVDYVALSFVRQGADLEQARALAARLGRRVPLIAKIEKSEAVEHLDDVLDASDAVMVARGDLGVEVGPERVPILQKQIVRAARGRGLPVIIATQMLETMIEQTLPTRAEASDVANAVWDDADALMLSGETAVGVDPAGAVATMARIAVAAEAAVRRLGEEPRPARGPHEAGRLSHAHAISHAARTLAEDLDVRAIVGLTRTGRTAHLLSADRPRVPILAFTPDERVYRELALWWGVRPLRCGVAPTVEAMIDRMERQLLQAGLAARGDAVLVVGAMPLRVGVHTNFVKVHRLGAARTTRGARA